MVRSTSPHPLLLVNPWIHDFAAYNLWSAPLGLLTLAGFLRLAGFPVQVLDALGGEAGNRDHQSFGTGKFLRSRIPKSQALKDIPRPYHRYGISPETFRQKLKESPSPALILVTSHMTYWYPGVQETIAHLKTVYPKVPVVLGGIYATLLKEHAIRESGADQVLPGRDIEEVPGFIYHYLGLGEPPDIPSQSQGRGYPAFDLLSNRGFVAIQTSRGCPYHCPYCASSFLTPVFQARDPDAVIREILFWHRKLGIQDFALYDDAFLVKSEDHALPLLKEMASLNLPVRFHTPNALHVKKISKEMACALKKAGFETIRLGLEWADPTIHQQYGGKVGRGDFERAVKNLKAAGFQAHQLGTYLLVGLPGQEESEILESIDYVRSFGLRPYLSEYSPLPHTPLWEEAVRNSRYDLIREPLFHNNSLWPCLKDFSWEKVQQIKQRERLPLPTFPISGNTRNGK
jgi:radical SAM superfamily enzyme YgiQ (UPF0313 family)